MNFQLKALGYQSFVSKVKVLATNVDFGPTTAECYGGHLPKYQPSGPTIIPSNKLVLIYVDCPDCQNLKNLNCDVTVKFGILVIFRKL